MDKIPLPAKTTSGEWIMVNPDHPQYAKLLAMYDRVIPEITKR